MNKNKSIILAVSAIALIVLIVVGATVAFFGWQSEEASVDVTVSTGTGTCEALSDNNVLLAPTANKANGRIITIKANQQMANKAYITWELIVNSIADLQHSSFKYELVNSTTTASYGTGNFGSITSSEGSNTINFENAAETLDYNKDYTFTLYLWIDGETFTNPTVMANQEFNFDMRCSITSANS